MLTRAVPLRTIAAVQVEPDPILVDYRLQRLSVPDPLLYIEVSADLPHTRSLSHILKNADEILEWMQQNLGDGSNFPDCEGRVMTSDEVIMFKTGNPIDRAILLGALIDMHELQVGPR